MISILLLIYFSSLLLRPTNVKNLLKLLGGFLVSTFLVSTTSAILKSSLKVLEGEYCIESKISVISGT
ncbi:hypothetical protein A7J09_08495 [Streptococcus suis]|nr:hypothetical protein A7J09_08305 [Streptococcus suis]AZR97628.1 hypothetical protein A7J10_07195 [Streptococcus suis]KPA66988.1 hypothetical protein XK27_06695 [Streptococcus suis]KPA70558.1 hypothetical protein XK26_00795 [Streptococcus suis]